MKLTAYSPESLSKLLGDLRQMFAHTGRLVVNASNAKTRTSDQNSLSHAWYAQVSNELREDSTPGVKRFCKLHFGVPILRAEDAEFRAAYDSVVKPLAYEKKLLAMDILPVTSRMNTVQLSQYLEAMQSHYHGRVALLFPLEQAA